MKLVEMESDKPAEILETNSDKSLIKKSINMADDGSAKSLEADSELMRTIQKSEKAISTTMDECIDMVMNVQVAGDMREVDRREKESKLSEMRAQFLEAEAKIAKERIDHINSKWEFIAQLKDSVDIYNAYESQKNSYLELIQKRDSVIKELQKGLEEANRKYVHDQNLHREDINILASRINEHRDVMQNAYRKHLKIIQNTAVEEQKSSLHHKHAEWEKQNHILEHEKIENMNDIFRAIEVFEKETIDIIWEHSEKHRSIKKDLETQLQTLQIKLKEKKAYCMLEERKLEYNYLVLSKRQEELGPIKARQRRRINLMQNELTNIENEKRELGKTHERKCARLQMDISKLEADKAALIQKVERTDDVNERIFCRTWKLNEKRIRRILNAILKMDQQTNEKVLCLKWISPTLKFKTVSELPSILLYTERVPDVEKLDSDSDQLEPASIFTIRNWPQLYPDFHILKFILHNVINCMRFVLKHEIDCLTECLDEEKGTLVKFDSAMKILDIQSEGDLESLKEHFISYIKCSTCVSETKRTLPRLTRAKSDRPSSTHQIKVGNENESSPVSKRPFSTPSRSSYPSRSVTSSPEFCYNSEHKWVIDQHMVVKLLANFIQEKRQREQREKYSGFIKIPINRVLTPSDMELYWKSFQPAYIEEVGKLWDILYAPLIDNLRHIKDGQAIENEMKALEKQNSELRRALNALITKDLQRGEE